MANLLATGAAWLGDQLQWNAGTSVTYTRGASTISGLTATASVVMHEVFDASGFPTSVRFHDFVFTAADLEISAAQIEPRPGDQISDGTNTYELMPVGKEKPCWEPMDTAGVLIVCHAKRVD